jgi:arginase
VALKIVRRPNQIAVIGAPSSAGAHNAGMEKAPAALRAAGLLDRLREAGFEISDLGDIPTFTCQPDEENPRARNFKNVVAALNALRPHIEVAAKSGALILVLGGECTMALATLAGLRRYYRSVNLLWLDSDADLNVPATSPSGIANGMVVAHIIGRGAPELVRFWGEPPLVREPDVVLFGLDRLDPPEAALLERSPMKRYTAADIHRRGIGAATDDALARIHAAERDFALHFDVDFIAGEDLPAVDFPGSGGIRLDQARQALETIAKQAHLLAIDVASYNPERDPEGTDARKIVDILVAALAARLAALPAPPVAAPKKAAKEAAAGVAVAAAAPPEPASAADSADVGPDVGAAYDGPAAAEPKAWSSESSEEPAEEPAESVAPADEESSAAPEETEKQSDELDS